MASHVCRPPEDGVPEHHAEPEERLRQLHLGEEPLVAAARRRVEVGGERVREHAAVVHVPVRAGNRWRGEIEVLRGNFILAPNFCTLVKDTSLREVILLEVRCRGS